MYDYRISKNLDRILDVLFRKNKPLYEQVIKKIDEVIKSSDVEHYKNLRYNMKNCKRVHIGHFVLVFSYDKKENLILFEDFDHHDRIYK